MPDQSDVGDRESVIVCDWLQISHLALALELV